SCTLLGLSLCFQLSRIFGLSSSAICAARQLTRGSRRLCNIVLGVAQSLNKSASSFFVSFGAYQILFYGKILIVEKEGSFTLSYLLSRQRARGVLRTEGILLHPPVVGGGRWRWATGGVCG